MTRQGNPRFWMDNRARRNNPRWPCKGLYREIALNEQIGALAHLGLANAYFRQGDVANARSAYNDFLALWKDADPDIPILKEAKAEYAKLQ